MFHAVYKNQAKDQARLAMAFHCVYGLLLIFLSVLSIHSGLHLESTSEGLSLASTGLRFQPSVYLDARNTPFLLLMGISLPLIFIWLRDKARVYSRGYYISANLLLFSLFGVFVSQSLILLYFFWELALIGAYFWIGMFGQAEDKEDKAKVYSALMRFCLVTLLGSLPMLLSIIWLCAAAGRDPGIDGISATLNQMPAIYRHWVFGGFLIAFAVKLPLLGFHGWLRDTYTVAPAACRTVLSALMSKMGAYGFILILAPGFPEECRTFALPLQWLCVAGVVYAAFLCLSAQKWLDILIYSSLGHLSLIALSVFSAQGNFAGTALTAAIFQVFNHGLIMTALFAFDARINKNGNSPLIYATGGLRKSQFRLTAILLLALFASASLPGLSNFAGEILVYYAAFQASPYLVFFASIGALLVAAAMFRGFHNIFFGKPVEGSVIEQAADFSTFETSMALALGAVWLLLGLYPMLLIQPIEKILLIKNAAGFP